MKNFNQRRSFGRQNFRNMHKATCAECGEVCEVPFRPSGDKPVYCSKCFESRRGGGDRVPRKDFGPQNFVKGGSNEEIKRQFETISNKLDQLIHSLGQLVERKKKVTVKKTK